MRLFCPLGAQDTFAFFVSLPCMRSSFPKRRRLRQEYAELCSAQEKRSAYKAPRVVPCMRSFAPLRTKRGALYAPFCLFQETEGAQEKRSAYKEGKRRRRMCPMRLRRRQQQAHTALPFFLVSGSLFFPLGAQAKTHGALYKQSPYFFNKRGPVGAQANNCYPKRSLLKSLILTR